MQNFHVLKIIEKEILEVHIDKGMQDGHKIPFRGMADEEPGTEAGDIIMILRTSDHEVFERKGKYIFVRFFRLTKIL